MVGDEHGPVVVREEREGARRDGGRGDSWEAQTGVPVTDADDAGQVLPLVAVRFPRGVQSQFDEPREGAVDHWLDQPGGLFNRRHTFSIVEQVSELNTPGVVRQGLETNPCSTMNSKATSAGSSPPSSTRRFSARRASSVIAGEIWSKTSASSGCFSSVAVLSTGATL